MMTRHIDLTHDKLYIFGFLIKEYKRIKVRYEHMIIVKRVKSKPTNHLAVLS